MGEKMRSRLYSHHNLKSNRDMDLEILRSPLIDEFQLSSHLLSPREIDRTGNKTTREIKRYHDSLIEERVEVIEGNITLLEE
jgi:hypothetical protein